MLRGRTFAGQDTATSQRVAILNQTLAKKLFAVDDVVGSLRNASHIEPGFETRNILSFSVSPVLDGYSATQAATYYRSLLERLNAIQGVKSAALATLLPLSYGQLQESVEMGQASGTSTQEIPVNANLVSSEYFRTIGISIILGRSFAKDEVDTTSVIVNQTLADRFFRGRDPIGQQLRLGGGEHQRVMTIIGVARDSKYRTLGEPSQPFIYESLPAGFEGPSGTTVLVKTTGDSQPLLSAIRIQASALDKNVPISPIETMSDHLKSDLWLARTTAIILVSLGGVGLFVAMIGLYGIVSYSVTRRTHEIGIRMALGAQRIDVLNMVAREGLFLILTGTGIGLAAALALTRFLGSLLYGLRATDPMTFAGVLILFVTIALLACYIPARRATRVDPLVALRCE